jgi:hypothetical protein
VTNNGSSDAILNSAGKIPKTEVLERLHGISRLSQQDWLDLLGLSWKDYYRVRAGHTELVSSQLQALLKHFQLKEEDFVSGNIDFRSLSIRHNNAVMPDYYMVAPHGRFRTTITSLEYVEKAYGWRLTQDIFKHFGVSEAAVQDPFAPVSMRFITDVCQYLHQRQFSRTDYYRMGLHSFEGNRQSIVGHIYAQMQGPEEVYQTFFDKLIRIFEHNSSYQYQQLAPTIGLMTMRSTYEVASELGLRYLGSPHICDLKSGIWASMTRYLGLSDAHVIHTTCEHRGDDACRFLIDFTDSKPVTSPLQLCS